MALKIALKPNEKIVVNGAVIANGDKPARLHFLNNARFLREKDIMQEGDAINDEDFLYFLIQLMYIDEDSAPGYHLQLAYAVDKIKEKHPDDSGQIDEIKILVDSGKIYEALKLCRKLYPQRGASDVGTASNGNAGKLVEGSK